MARPPVHGHVDRGTDVICRVPDALQRAALLRKAGTKGLLL
jgi:hypothetical protein